MRTALLALLAPAALAMEFNVHGLVGGKRLDGDWDPVERQPMVGVVADLALPLIPFAVAANVIGSRREDGDDRGETREVQLGLRKNFGLPALTPFIGAGIDLVDAQRRVGGLKDDDDGVGWWVDGGVFWTIGGHLTLGPRICYSSAEVKLFGDEVDAGGWSAGLLVGFHL